MWIKRTWAKLFGRRRPNYSEKEITVDIVSSLSYAAKKGRLNIYNGTIQGLRSAQADHLSIVYVVEIVNPVERQTLINFSDYVNRLKSIFRRT
jgi:hypothetical protein